MRYMLKVIIVAILLFDLSTLDAQVKARTEAGLSVVLNKDGTWEIDKDTSSLDCASLVKYASTSESSGLISKADIEIVNSFGDKVRMSFTAIKNTVAISATVKGVGTCISKGDDVVVVFTDKSSLKLNYSSTKMDCESTYLFLLGKTFENEKELNKLGDQLISSLGFTANKKMAIFAVPELEAKKIKVIVNCIKP